MEVENVLTVVYYLSHVRGYEDVFLVVLNLSGSMRYEIVRKMEYFHNEALERYFGKLGRVEKYVPTMYRAKYYPRTMFASYMEDRILNGDLRPAKLYYEARKRGERVQSFEICVPCGKKKYLVKELGKWMVENGPCDMEHEEKKVNVVKKRFIDMAIGPGMKGYDDGWEMKESKKQKMSEEEEEEELTPEEKEKKMVEILTKKDPKPPSGGVTGLLGAMGMLGAWNLVGY